MGLKVSLLFFCSDDIYRKGPTKVNVPLNKKKKKKKK